MSDVKKKVEVPRIAVLVSEADDLNPKRRALGRSSEGLADLSAERYAILLSCAQKVDYLIGDVLGGTDGMGFAREMVLVYGGGTIFLSVGPSEANKEDLQHLCHPCEVLGLLVIL